MRLILLTTALCTAFALDCSAQTQTPPASDFRLSAADCKLVTKRSEREYYVNGTIAFPWGKFGDSNVLPNSTIINGFDVFTTITKSCFS